MMLFLRSWQTCNLAATTSLGAQQVFFPDAVVATDSTYSFCLPDVKISDAGAFLKTTWGIEFVDDKLTVPISAWDGQLSSGLNVFDAGRLDGSKFVGNVDALRPPVPDATNKVLPFMGIKCDGAAFMQFGTPSMGGGAMAPGMKSMFDFMMDQVMSMQKCRGAQRDPKYKFLRPDFMNNYAMYTPKWAISAITKPPAGEEFDIFTAALTNSWSKVTIEMSTLMNNLVANFDLGDDLKLKDVKQKGGYVNFEKIGTCTAKGYDASGCMISANVKDVVGTPDAMEFVFGAKQCMLAA